MPSTDAYHLAYPYECKFPARPTLREAVDMVNAFDLAADSLRPWDDEDVDDTLPCGCSEGYCSCYDDMAGWNTYEELIYG